MAKKMKKVLALLLATAILFVMVFSSAFVIMQSNHCCITHHCNICYQITSCQNNFVQFSFIFVLVSLLLFLIALIVMHKRNFVNHYYHTTLISLKVKLSD